MVLPLDTRFAGDFQFKSCKHLYRRKLSVI
jgi:hypothetical protein